MAARDALAISRSTGAPARSPARTPYRRHPHPVAAPATGLGPARLPLTRTSPLRITRKMRLRGTLGSRRLENCPGAARPASGSTSSAALRARTGAGSWLRHIGLVVRHCFYNGLCEYTRVGRPALMAAPIRAHVARLIDSGRRMLVGPLNRGHRIGPTRSRRLRRISRSRHPQARRRLSHRRFPALPPRNAGGHQRDEQRRPRAIRRYHGIFAAARRCACRCGLPPFACRPLTAQ